MMTTLPAMHCERCHLPFRQLVQTLLSVIVQNWYAEPGKKTRHVAEIDEDMCDECEDDFIVVCNTYNAGNLAPAGDANA